MDLILFEKAGKENTEATLQCAKKNADQLGIKAIILASTKGDTISKALTIMDPKSYHLICVTHNYGFNEDGNQEMPQKIREESTAKGISFVTGTLAFSGVSSALLRKYQHFDAVALFARLLRGLIGDGVKVCAEIVMMATDAGVIKAGDEVIAVAGTGYGADTCCLIKAASSRFFDKLRIEAILAKPK